MATHIMATQFKLAGLISVVDIFIRFDLEYLASLCPDDDSILVDIQGLDLGIDRINEQFFAVYPAQLLESRYIQYANCGIFRACQDHILCDC